MLNRVKKIVVKTIFEASKAKVNITSSRTDATRNEILNTVVLSCLTRYSDFSIDFTLHEYIVSVSSGLKILFF